MNKRLTVLTALSVAMSGVGGVAVGQTAGDGQFVTKEQYNQLLQRYEQLEKQMKEVLDRMSNVVPAPMPGSTNLPSGYVSQATFDDLKKQVDETHAMAKTSFPGSTKLNISGYGAAGFTYQQNGGDQLFTAQFNPLFLWKLSDKLLFEGELELELENGDTHAGLEQAHLAYLLNDYMTIDAGKFLNPMDSFVERYHMAWVNHLPDHPLAVYDGLLPETFVGAQIRGGAPIGSTAINYSAFVGNSPTLVTMAGGDQDVGTLAFDNFDNIGKNFTAGGHVGFLPIPELEIGYGFMAGQVSALEEGAAAGSPSAFMQSVDLNYVRDSQALRGLVRVNAQWVWSHVGSYDGYTTAEGDSLGYVGSNNRNGGYAQICYRPTKWDNATLAKLETVFRFDMLNQNDTPTGFDQSRYTIGLNYWILPMTVFKVAYQFDNVTGGQTPHNAVLLQFATGF